MPNQAKQLPELITIMRCVECGSTLREEESQFICNGTLQHQFNKLRNIPILIRKDNLDFSESFLSPTCRKSVSFINKLITLRMKIHSRECFKILQKTLLNDSIAPIRILVIGGGELGIGMDRIINDPRISWVESDIYCGHRTGLICDGHSLPFDNDSFDAVICQSVLEHVRNPHVVANEAIRVLRSGGIIFVQASFMQQIHEGRADYFRFTPRALRLLFSSLEVMKWGASLGIAVATAWSVRYLLRALLSKFPGGRMISYLIYCAILYPAFLVDLMIAQTPLAKEGASEIYLLLRKRISGDVPLTEADIFP